MKISTDKCRRLLISLALGCTALTAYSCSWDNSLYDEFVKNGNIVTCPPQADAELSYIEIHYDNKSYQCSSNGSVSGDGAIPDEVAEQCSKFSNAFEYKICPADYSSCQPETVNGATKYKCTKGCTGDTVSCSGICINLEVNHVVSCPESNEDDTEFKCEDNYEDCDGSIVNGCEVNVMVDRTNCGSCGELCPAGQVCSGGTCGLSCQDGLEICQNYCLNLEALHIESCPDTGEMICAKDNKDCDSNALNGCEINTANDANNCGGCGIVCSDTMNNHTNTSAAECRESKCVAVACAAGFHIENGECTADTVENCSGQNCRDYIVGWEAGRCELGVCTADECIVGYHLKDNKCIADTNEACGNTEESCQGSQVCSKGKCSDSCQTPLSQCTGTAPYCANLTSDIDNCGACGSACTADSIANSESVTCKDRKCQAIACAVGYHTAEDANTKATVCAQDTIEHCGSEKYICKDHTVGWNGGECIKGFCKAKSCIAGYHLKDDKCVADTNEACGSEEKSCQGSQVCSQGVCTDSCKSPLSQCNGTVPYCANLTSDIDNCGACGSACTADSIENSESVTCKDRKCQAIACKTSFHLVKADNKCVQDSIENCGSEGYICKDHVAGWNGGDCIEGFCKAESCIAGYHLKDNKCIADTNEACGNTEESCQETQVCSQGVCTDSCKSPLSQCTGTVPYCANLTSDIDNCGACGSACTAESIEHSKSVTCKDRKCQAISCAVGYHAAEDANTKATVCAQDTIDNCGSAGYKCADHTVGWNGGECIDGVCMPKTCSDEYYLETNPNVCRKKDFNHCGSDGSVNCTAAANALNGNCTANKCQAESCPKGYHLKDSDDEVSSKICVIDTNEECGENPDTGKPNNCAIINEICQEGTCVDKCQTGSEYTNCSGLCVNTVYDVSNCGACGVSCIPKDTSNTAAFYCSNSKCILNCTDGYEQYYNEAEKTYACVCKVNTAKCTADGTALQTCSADHNWTDTSCAYGCVTDAGVSQCAECKTGDTKCIGGSIQTCNNGKWSEASACSGGASCKDSTACGDCTNTATECTDGKIKTCTNGVWGAETACDNNYSCTADGKTCGVCVNQTYQCSDSNSMICTNGAWAINASCENECNAATGQCNGCVNNATECTGNQIRTCTDGAWGTYEACDNNYSCTADGKTCGVCVNQTYQCSDSNSMICTNGAWAINASCENECNAATGQCNGCVNNATECTGNQIRTCTDGAWGTYEACDNNYSCTADGKKCGVCENQTYQCSDSNSMICTNGAWAINASCENGCDAATGQCNGCVNNATECTGNQIRTCTDGAWGTYEACDNNYSCAADGKKCGVCTNGVTECTGNQIRTCANGAWGELSACSNGASCKDSTSCGDCTNGVTECTGNQFKTCTNGVWGAETACDNNYSCTADGKTCGVCTNGVTECTGNQIRTCANGAWGELSACSNGASCKDSTSCGDCTNGVTECTGNQFKTCTNGVWGAETACDNNYSCMADGKTCGSCINDSIANCIRDNDTGYSHYSICKNGEYIDGNAYNSCKSSTEIGECNDIHNMFICADDNTIKMCDQGHYVFAEDCRDKPSINNGTYTCQSDGDGLAVCSVTCLGNYQVVGESCKLPCVDYTNASFNNEEFGCMDNSTLVICDSGYWDESSAEKCIVPEHGSAVCDAAVSDCRYTCNEGYVLNSDGKTCAPLPSWCGTVGYSSGIGYGQIYTDFSAFMPKTTFFKCTDDITKPINTWDNHESKYRDMYGNNYEFDGRIDKPTGVSSYSCLFGFTIGDDTAYVCDFNRTCGDDGQSPCGSKPPVLLDEAVSSNFTPINEQ